MLIKHLIIKLKRRKLLMYYRNSTLKIVDVINDVNIKSYVYNKYYNNH